MAATFDLDPTELTLLVEACRTADELERLVVAVAEAPLEVQGSTGQPRAQPLLDEVRKHRQTLATLVAGLRLPQLDAETGEAPATINARRVARARWDRGA